MNKKVSMTYEQAMKRLEQIVSQIENGQMDVDSLAASLKEAKELVDFCKGKLLKAEKEVKNILDDKEF
ncbi:MAG: exodeoxyribonuclease VII small subunit [Bacteroides sp.]|nr:exodeoxyribonuclease VII small subunit [Roseburia sp.]MCM1346929.1 exodeoxyribonuclease VII small subunit [Bacteroides sp.]MCM1421505.1 exodeoxyribonuclease VII small subunit [Bacteroides sp.]